MTRPAPGRSALVAATVLLCSPAAPALAQAPARPQLYVIENVRLQDDDDAPRVKLVLSGGRVERVLESSAGNPAGARTIDGKGGLVVPAFIDAFTRAGCETPAPAADRDRPVSTGSDVRVDMREAGRKGIQPAFRAVDVYALPDKQARKIREAGFGAMLSAPTGNLLAGQSAVATLREAAPRDTMLVPAAFVHAAFRAPGGGYPGTLMGYMAQLRQFFLDARRHRELSDRYAAGRPGERPPFDADLEAILPALGGDSRVFCQAQSHRDVERWIRLADEAGLDIAITGGRDAWRVAGVLAERRIPVILTLDWGDEVKDPDEKEKEKEKKKEKEEEEVEPEGGAEAEAEGEVAEEEEESADESSWEYTEPLAVRRERRRLWEERRDCALRLHEAGVPFAFGSDGDSPGDLLKRVRKVVEAGLPADVALAALTSEAARLLGVDTHLGSVAPGKDATLAVWTEHPTSKEARLAWLFVDGFPYEFELEDLGTGEPDEGVDSTGTWTIEMQQRGETRTSTALLKMTPEGEVTGTMTMENPAGEGKISSDIEGHVSGVSMALKGSYTVREMEITFTMKGDLEGETWSGTTTTKGPFGEFESSFSAERDPEARGSKGGPR